MIRQDTSELCVSLGEAQAYARIETGEEEAVLAGLLRVANEVCEEFIGQAIMIRPFEQSLSGQAEWKLLGLQPVRSIASIAIAETGMTLSTGSYRTDIDHDGRGYVAGLVQGVRYTVSGVAGLAANSNEVPEPLRQGILRLAAYLFANRDAPVGDIPRAVTALWRPYRRAGLFR